MAERRSRQLWIKAWVNRSGLRCVRSGVVQKGAPPEHRRAMPRTTRKPAKAPALRRIGTRIKKLREDQGLSQEALADRADIGRSYMSGIERGVRNCSTLHLLRIARALQVPPADLLPD